ncbi:uncharacterized protein HMPREF1541_05368 [Cyphellophora europaea CBS 101466]|uniref:Major facilitator superfamily (MFS) profile domain-containing protein n=1 Tax=Cyphellophora europaea (strain CBS 101466) TaxID=1220924 RepID=W2RS54_CYPE1|nr:uncharacterized protein HMPREF1541_05368 [Cyphellophora europaea CBS 101466]ETN39145.1 hypothetical protein HMPREF1541_05368 [Cyphellophora europaea CBS 101466]
MDRGRREKAAATVRPQREKLFPSAPIPRILNLCDRLDFWLLPLLVVGFFVLQLDRSNIGNALSGTIAEDLGVSKDDINAGNQLQIAAIVAFEIPSNLVLQRVGPSRWISFLCVAWGLVATFQAFCSGKASFHATRFLLGMFEAGYIPGCQYVLASFYKRKELATRTAVFYVGNYFAAGTGSLMAAGILDMHGKHGLSGWQWLFLIEGCITMAVAVTFILILPESPARTVGLARISRLNPFKPHENHILQQRIFLDDPYKEASGNKITLAAVAKALADVRLWGHLAINVLSLAPKGGLQLYSPSIIKSLGFSTSRANALNSVSNYGVIVLSLLVSWASDRTQIRGLWCLAAGSYSLIFAGVLWGLPLSADKWKKYAILTVLNSGNAVSQGLNDAWLSSNCRTPQQRSIGLALAVMGSNLGGLAGQQLFRSSDAPHYTNGFLAIVCLYSAALLAVTALMAFYWHGNRQLARLPTSPPSASNDGTGAAAEEHAVGTSPEQMKPWRYEI